MRNIIKVFAVVCIGLTAGCGGETNSTPDAGKAKVDAGSCPTAQACGTKCCGSDQSCINGACVTCGCDAKECGEDACGQKCGANAGTCPFPKTCNTTTQMCEGSGCSAIQTACGSTCCNNATQVCNGTACVDNTATCTTGQTACGSACCTAAQSCVNAACVANTTCTVGKTACGTNCCDANQACQNGACVSICTAGQEFCNGTCCTATQSCVSNACVNDTTCTTGQTACGTACCDTATQVCASGACVAKSCGTGQTACGTQCCTTATQVCVSGSCQAKPTCGTGQSACGTTCCTTATQYCDASSTCQAKPTCGSGQSACGSTCCTDSTQVCVSNTCQAKPTCNANQIACGADCCDSATETCNASQVCVTKTTSDCDPLNQSSCPSAGCYVNSTFDGFECAGPGSIAADQTCTDPTTTPGTCIPGYECMQESDTDPFTCHQYCAVATSGVCGVKYCYDIGDGTTGICGPCPATQACPTVCCADTEKCDTTSNTCVALTACDPLAPTACASGEGCYYAGGGNNFCLPAGTGDIGASCTADSDCKPLMTCYPVSSSAGACGMYCNPTAGGTPACATGEICNDYQDGTGYCTVDPNKCDPLTQTGCTTGQGCYYSSTIKAYDCATAGTVDTGGSCTADADCKPGLGCNAGYYDICSPYCDPAGTNTCPTAYPECGDFGDGTGGCWEGYGY